MEKLEYKEKGGECQLLMDCCALMHKSLERDESLSSVLSLLGENLQANKIGLYVRAEPDVIYRTYDWSREKGFSNLGTSDIFLQGEAVFYSCSVSEAFFYDEADILFFEKKLLADYGIILEHDAKTMLILPLVYGGDVKGFIGIEDLPYENVARFSASLLYLPFVIMGPVFRKMENDALRKASGVLSDTKLVYELTMENAKLVVFDTNLDKKVTVVVD